MKSEPHSHTLTGLFDYAPVTSTLVDDIARDCGLNDRQMLLVPIACFSLFLATLSPSFLSLLPSLPPPLPPSLLYLPPPPSPSLPPPFSPLFHSVAGAPGGYTRIATLRLDECATYGCLLELTIQLGIIMVGKQVLNNCQELALP